MNNSCLVTFFYPGIEKKINKFFKCIKSQSDSKFDLLIFFNNKKNFLIPKNIFKIKIIKLNTSIINSRFYMLKKIKKLKYKNYIFQDADDLMKSNRVEISKNLLRKHNVIINDLDIYGGKIINNYLSKRIKAKSIITAKDILNYNFCGMSNTALRSKCLKKISIPNSNKIKIFDWYFWTIILSKYKAFYTNDTTTKYFVNRKSETHLPTLKNKKIMLKILNIKKNHKQKIKKLIERKKIININVLKENKISQNKKYNFWWE